jgi:type I restriction enzyme S subunit
MREGWEKIQLGHIFNFIGGGTPSKQIESYWNGNIPWASIKDLKGTFLLDTRDSISTDGLENSSSKMADPDELIIGTRINPGHPIITKIHTAINQDLKIVRSRIPISTKYVFFFFQYSEREIIKNSSGTTVLGINLNNLRDFPFPLPPLPEQRAIVAKIEQLFSELDNGIANLKAAQAKLELYRQAVLKKAFEGDWKRVRLDKITHIVGGVTKGKKFKQEDVRISAPYLRVANVQDGYLDLSIIKEIEVSKTDYEKYQLVYGDILFTEGGDRDKLGRGTIWQGEIENCIHQNHIFRARILNQNDALPSFIAYFAQSKDGRDYFYKNAKQTVNLASINKTVLSGLELPLPNIEQQKQIVEDIENKLLLHKHISEELTRSMIKTDLLQQSILKKAFAGELLNQAELESCKREADWEPASKLLERIKSEVSK